MIIYQVCNKFNFCVDGVPNTITCAGGLIFDPSKGQCDYADQVRTLSVSSIYCPYPSIDVYYVLYLMSVFRPSGQAAPRTSCSPSSAPRPAPPTSTPDTQTPRVRRPSLDTVSLLQYYSWKRTSANVYRAFSLLKVPASSWVSIDP